jgi:TonB-dependent receptor
MTIYKEGFLTMAMLILSILNINGQTGRIAGKVVDSKTGETLIGVAVYIEGTTTGASTDLDGQYSIANLTPGKYKIAARYVSFKLKLIEEVVVKATETTSLNIALEENTTELGEVIITSTYNRESSNVLLLEQKNAIQISDGISADAIKKSPDSNSGDVLKRVSGASIQDNKFVVIRGLNDRYNQAMLNGAPLPSSEPDKKAFAFDIFPANLLDNIVISKTAAPNLGGDVAGGTISINTKDIPEENFYSFSIGASANTLTTGKPFYTYQGGKTDYIGLDDGTRQDVLKEFPDADTYKNLKKSEKLPFAKNVNSSWVLNNSKNAIPAQNFQFVAGHKIKGTKSAFGSLFALTYSNNFTMQPVTRRDFDKNLIFELQDSSYKFSVLAGALWNVSYRIGNNHKISFKNLFNINSEDQTVTRQGYDVQKGNDIRSYAMYYQQNTMMSNQLSGDHLFPKKKIKLEWIAGHSDIKRITPNFRRISYIKPIGDTTDTPYQAVIGSTANPNDAGMFFSDLNEKILSGRVDLSIPFEKIHMNIKTGVASQQRTRDFQSRLLGYVRYAGQFQSELLYEDLGSIFDTSNISKQGYLIDEQTAAPDKYTASSNLNAAYIMGDNLFFDKLRVVYGVRMEQFNQKLNSKTQSQDTVDINTTITDFLPSINLSYALTSKTNLRFSASQTVNRPEFRELAPFSFFDFNQFLTVEGSPTLQRAKILNADMRLEYYPQGGEILSATIFYKDFTNPIEQILKPGIGGGTRIISYRNITKASNYGLELEARKKFDWLANLTGAQWLNNLSFIFNLALIKSEVDLTGVVGSIASSRPLQGQSPYVLNSGLMYTNVKHNFAVSAMYNQVGRRLFAVGNIDYRDVFENPRSVIDLQVSKKFGKHFEMKASISDLLAQNLVFYQDIDGNKKYNSGDQVLYDYFFGRTISVGLNYRF